MSNTHNTIRLPQKQFLDQSIVSNLPPGRIDKNVTGIGATTHEILNIGRNSIIVVPTRAVARCKTQKHFNVYYIAGDVNLKDQVTGVRNQVQEGISKVKIIVVADSLGRFIEMYGDDIYHTFFILFDEVDAFQEDSDYRGALQISMEYYFKFPPNKRALMSATLQNFSDQRLNEEPLTEILINRKWGKVFCIKMEGSTVKILVELIIQKRLKSNSRKLFIGLNNFKLINQTIALLGDEYKNDIGVLCSPQSQGKVKEYFQLLNPDGTLPKPIIFATSAYYVGLDIEEAPFILAVADYEYENTLFTMSRLIQFFGRARKPGVQYTFLYKTFAGFNADPAHIEGELLEITESSTNIITELDKLRKNSLAKGYMETFKDFIVEGSRYNSLPLIRYDGGKYKPNYFIIDHIRLGIVSRNALYTKSMKTAAFLKSYFHEVVHSDRKGTLTETQINVLNGVRGISRNERKQEYLKILKGKPCNINDRIATALETLIGFNHRDINIEEVISRAKKHLDSGQILKGLNELIFQSVMYSKGAEFIEYLNLNFPLGSKYTNDEISAKMKYLFEIFAPILLEEVPSLQKLTKQFNLLIETEVISARPKRLYKVVGLHTWLFPVMHNVRKSYNLDSLSQHDRSLEGWFRNTPINVDLQAGAK